MKRISITILMIAGSVLVFAQPDHDLPGKFALTKQPACDTRVELADSSINYSWNFSDRTYTPASVIMYFYNADWNLTTVICKTLPDRDNIYRQIFEYDENQNITKYNYQLWESDGWRDNLITERTYNSEGLINTEVFIRENAIGEFVPYQRHFYTHNEGRVTGYLRQVLDASGSWYDFSEHVYVYDNLGRLTILYGKYYNSDLVYWERTSVYGLNDKISERYLKQLRYDPVEKRNILNYSTLQKYHYNIFGSADTIYNYEYNRTDQRWEHVSKDEGYFSLIKRKKVSICHNGVHMCVMSNVVRIHLDHGDKLGECFPVLEDRGVYGSEPIQGTKSAFSLYPNPTTELITVKIEGAGEGYCTATVFSSDGKSVLSSDVSGQTEITFNVSNLQSGAYYLLMINEKGFDTKPFIKK